MSTKERKEIEKENRRNLILDASEKVMQTHGLHGLSIDLIAQETQLAKGTIYLYFKSKEEILSILTIKARSLLLKEFEKIERSKEPNIEKLKGLLKANYLFYKRNQLMNDLVSLYEVNNKVAETGEMKLSSEKFGKLITSIAIKAKEDGTLNPTIDPKMLSMSIWAMSVGMLQLIKVRGQNMKDEMNISEKDILHTFSQLLETGMRK